MQKLPGNVDEIRWKVSDDKFINDMIDRIKHKNQQKIDMYSILNYILMYGERVVISISLQKRILKEFDVGYPGIARMKTLIRNYVHWTKMDKDMENLIKFC